MHSPEIVLYIFQNLNSIDDAISFARCSRFHAKIYLRHKPSIIFNALRHDPVLDGNFDKAAELFLLLQKSKTLTSTLKTVNALLGTATIINNTARDASTRLVGENRGYDQTTYTILTKNSRSILTTALYDLWILLASGEELEQKYFNGHAYSDAHHPKNQLVSASLCFHLANYQYHERWGFPDVVPAFPRLLTRSCSMPDIKDLVVKNSLVEECKRREAEARTAAMDKEIKAMEITQMASGGSPGWIATAFPSYRSAQVKELEKSNTRMKKQLKGLKESQAKMEERLNELEAWKKQIGTVFKKLGGTK